MRLLNDLERSIVSALQIDPRCSWRKIAAVLGESERTISRKGTELVESGIVSVVGIRAEPAAVVAELACNPGTARAAAASLALRNDTSFSYTVSGNGDVVAEVLTTADRLGTLISEELPSTVGLKHMATYPVLQYFRTIRGWRPFPLSPARVKVLESIQSEDIGRLDTAATLSSTDASLLEALCIDGRMTFEALARRANVSEATARRRTDWLLAAEQVQLRVVLEPAILGLPVEALLWIKANPARVSAIGAALSADPQVRYAAALAGDRQILADVAVEDSATLYQLVSESPWASEVISVDICLVLEARKRGGKRLTPSAW